MVEQYKREGIDIVLDSRKCIYTNDKNEKFIKQNKEYIPIVKKKGKYVIINKKGGGPKSFGERLQDWKSAEREREREKIPEKLKESIPPHSSNEEIDEKTKLKNDIETKIKYIELLNIELTKNEKDKKSIEIEYNNNNIKNQNSGLFFGNRMVDNSQLQYSINKLTSKISAIKKQINIENKKLENQEEWDKSSPNLEKEQFMKEITEKEELIKSLQEHHIQYVNKMNREELYRDIYLKEKNNDIDLYFIDERNYPFLVEHLLKRIIDLEKRIDMTHN